MNVKINHTDLNDNEFEDEAGGRYAAKRDRKGKDRRNGRNGSLADQLSSIGVSVQEVSDSGATTDSVIARALGMLAPNPTASATPAAPQSAPVSPAPVPPPAPAGVTVAEVKKTGLEALLEAMKESARVAKLLDKRAKEAETEKRPLAENFFSVPSGITNLLASMDRSARVAKLLDEREREEARARVVAAEAAKAKAAAQAAAAAKASAAAADGDAVKALILEAARAGLAKNESQLEKFAQLIGTPSMAPLVQGLGALLIQLLGDKPDSGKAMRAMIETHLELTLNDPEVDLGALIKAAASFK